ncbi:MAG TPA: glycerol-3-phosphate acyltransferase [Thermoleophilia bacterium]|nr:glycerol-3-phosphate acyltransferase [Thermoleophilia bacterium]
MSRSRGTTLALVGLPAAFALGCIPSARIVARLWGGLDIEETGDRKPGAANVTRSLGIGAGVATAAIDMTKGYAVATIVRAAGGGPSLVGAVAATPVAAHIVVVRGRGAAAALGSAFAIDPAATGVVLVPILGGTALKRAGLGVMIGALALPVVSLALGHRRRALWGAALPALMAYARLRGSDGDFAALTPRVAWERFWFDRDPDPGPTS